MKFGVYFYPWYHQKKWDEAPVPYRPLKGLYDSRDPEILTWQMDLIRWCGFDYVLIEFVPLKDWNFEHCAMCIQEALSCLHNRNMKWAFMVDAGVIPSSGSRIHDIEAMIRYIENRRWADALARGKSGKPLWFAFSALPHEAACLERDFNAYEWRFPVWVPHWDKADEQLALPAFRDFVAEARANNVTVFDSLVRRHYIAFWQSSHTPRNFDGFCSVIPGYSDSLLKRDPQLAPEVDRQNGVTLTRQFQAAVKTQPDHILVYSWNEYFEGTSIEPTLEYDMTYAQIIRGLIGEARQQQNECETQTHLGDSNAE
ncbi:MAG TPA: hypothetical protein VMC85_05745 [Desulfomonilaceae bacterium]|nr:hypothetical protein [Desulfomonilaceae bacterium]